MGQGTILSTSLFPRLKICFANFLRGETCAETHLREQVVEWAKTERETSEAKFGARD